MTEYGKQKGHHCWWLTRNGKSLAHFDDEEEVDRIIMVAGERDDLLEMTTMFDDHPEDYEGPCMCRTCVSYCQ